MFTTRFFLCNSIFPSCFSFGRLIDAVNINLCILKPSTWADFSIPICIYSLFFIYCDIEWFIASFIWYITWFLWYSIIWCVCNVICLVLSVAQIWKCRIIWLYSHIKTINTKSMYLLDWVYIWIKCTLKEALHFHHAIFNVLWHLYVNSSHI